MAVVVHTALSTRWEACRGGFWRDSYGGRPWDGDRGGHGCLLKRDVYVRELPNVQKKKKVRAAPQIRNCVFQQFRGKKTDGRGWWYRKPSLVGICTKMTSPSAVSLSERWMDKTVFSPAEYPVNDGGPEKRPHYSQLHFPILKSFSPEKDDQTVCHHPAWRTKQIDRALTEFLKPRERTGSAPVVVTR